MSNSSTSASEPRGAGRAARRYLALVALCTAALAVAFLALAGLAYGVRIAAGPDAVAARLLAKLAVAEDAAGQRILIFAGSHGLYNISAERLEAATGRPAINLSTHASQSLPFLVWQVRRTARPGDLVVLPLEGAFLRGGRLTTYGVRIAHAAGLPLFAALSPAERIRYLRELELSRLLAAAAARLGLRRGLTPADLDLDVTPRGDLRHPPQDRAALAAVIADLRPGAAPARPSPIAASRLAALVEWAEVEGITVVFAPPGVADPMAPTPAQAARVIAAIAALGGTYLPFDRNGAIPAEAMLDTPYHAGADGAELYTAALIEGLCRRVARLDCARDEVARARRTLHTAWNGGIVFGEDPRLRTLRQEGLELAKGETLPFAVAAPAGCRNGLRLVAEGDVSVRLGGTWQSVPATPGRPGRGVALPATGTLVDLVLRADEPARLAALRRVSYCD